MNSPLISIIIPSFNAEKTISKTLESIVTQSFAGFEVLVIDGLSNDGTREVVEFFSTKDNRIRLFSEKDTGIYDAMNKGIDRSAGSWLFFLGADDMLFDKGVLEKIVGRLANTAAALVYGNVRIRGNSTSLKEGDIYDGKFTIAKLFRKNISHQAIFYNKSIFASLGRFDVRYPVCADWDLNHRCFARVEVEYVDQVIADFFVGGLSTERWDEYVVDCVVNLKRYYRISYFNPLFKTYSWSFYNQAKKEARNHHYLRALYFSFFSFIYSNDLLLLTKSYINNMMSSRKGHRPGLNEK